jgi:sorbitol-specific phosphotransferase system component IIBC
LLILLRWLSALRLMYYAAGASLVMLLTALVMIALSLILALPLLRSMFGSGNFMDKVSRFVGRLAPYRIGLGFACLVLALYSLLGRAF